MTEIERSLAALGRELDYPPTPDIAALVSERIEHHPRPRPRRSPVRRTVAITVASLLVLAGTAVAAVPGVRDQVLDWLGLGGAEIERVPETPVPPPGQVGADLDLGRPATLRSARSSAAFELLVPALEPDAVYVADSPGGARVTLAYEPRPGIPRAGATGTGMLVTQLRGSQSTQLLHKTVGPSTTVEPVTVNGDRGVWIAGAPHSILYNDDRGEVREETLRLAGNVLLWRRGEVLVRIEADVPKAAALAIARTMR